MELPDVLLEIVRVESAVVSVVERLERRLRIVLGCPNGTRHAGVRAVGTDGATIDLPAHADARRGGYVLDAGLPDRGFGPLVDATQRWDQNELYWVTKHGIKMSGMPAWEYHLSEDELWAVVAFVTVLPSMDTQAFKAATQPEPAP